MLRRSTASAFRRPGPLAAPLLLLAAICALPAPSPAQAASPGSTQSDQVGDDNAVSLFPHSTSDRYWLSGQANFIGQWHPAFHSPYAGPNSLSPWSQEATSRVLTLYTGLRLGRWSELLFDLQETGGHGIGEALGLAGFTNLDVVRNPALGKSPYVARLIWHQIIPLGTRTVESERNPLSLFSRLPERRIELRLGKMSLVDFFDLNAYGTDSNFQFLNWAVDNNGAYDYAADTRGYTYAAMAEYDDRRWAARFAEALMPKVANGIHIDADLARAHAENVEFELHGSPLFHKQGVLRLLAFVNHANMGVYSVAVRNFLDGSTPTPEITAHPPHSAAKYGFGVNLEQPLNEWLGIFGRWGWNEGQHESYVYTEIDQTVLVGLGTTGVPWGRAKDRLGAAFVSNGISRDHQQYLALGGDGFLLGDGRLDYGRENIAELYYTLRLWRGIYPSFDFQVVDHPGYNRDRGPVFVPGLRLHLEF